MTDSKTSPSSKRRFRINPIIWATLFQGILAITSGPGYISVVLIIFLGMLNLTFLAVGSTFKIDDWSIAWAIVWLSIPATYFASPVLNQIAVFLTDP